jgi:hypothetical protein
VDEFIEGGDSETLSEMSRSDSLSGKSAEPSRSSGSGNSSVELLAEVSIRFELRGKVRTLF